MTGSASRVILITGGTEGIGRAIAQMYLKGGDRVATCSRSPRDPSLPRRILHQQLDVRKRKDLINFTEMVHSQFKGLDVFINCAGISRWRAVQEIDERFIEEVVETNLLGTLWGCAAAARFLLKGGCIVNVSSLAGKRGSANNSAYCAAKFGVNGITQALAKELGPRGIRVNAVCPVYVQTETIRSSLSEPAAPTNRKGVGAYLKIFAKTQTALGRLPMAREIAEVVSFLSSPSASAITGQCLNVDCGTFPQ